LLIVDCFTQIAPNPPQNENNFEDHPFTLGIILVDFQWSARVLRCSVLKQMPYEKIKEG